VRPMPLPPLRSLGPRKRVATALPALIVGTLSIIACPRAPAGDGAPDAAARQPWSRYWLQNVSLLDGPNGKATKEIKGPVQVEFLGNGRVRSVPEAAEQFDGYLDPMLLTEPDVRRGLMMYSQRAGDLHFKTPTGPAIGKLHPGAFVSVTPTDAPRVRIGSLGFGKYQNRSSCRAGFSPSISQQTGSLRLVCISSAVSSAAHSPTSIGNSLSDGPDCTTELSRPPTPRKGRPIPAGGAVALAVGGYRSCAVLKDGTVWCWGDDADLSLQGPWDQSPPPQLVPELSGAASAAQHRFATCFINAQSQAHCFRWSNGHFLSAGRVDRARRIVVGPRHACAVRENGELETSRPVKVAWCS
jgi:hypothetical protein